MNNRDIVIICLVIRLHIFFCVNTYVSPCNNAKLWKISQQHSKNKTFLHFFTPFLTHFSKTDRVLHPKTNKRLHISLKKLSYFCILPSISIRYKKDRNIIIPLMIHHLTMDHLWSFLRGRADIYIKHIPREQKESECLEQKNCGTSYYK